MRSDDDILMGNVESFTAIPANTHTLLSLAAQHPDATLVSGCTDVGLWITKQLRTLPKIIHLNNVRDLHEMSSTATSLSLGAAITYAEAEQHLSAIDPDVAEVLRRLGSKQVRASGTIGGNIANGSPIGDMPPLLIALAATVTLRAQNAERTMPLENFFLAYGKQDRAPGELVWRIDIPKLQKAEVFRAYKITKRFDQDISAVMAAFRFTLASRRIESARIAFGGLAAIPKRAALTEKAMIGLSIDDTSSCQSVVQTLARDFQPISDMRASAAYRIETAAALLTKALTEIAGAASDLTRITGHRGKVA